MQKNDLICSKSSNQAVSQDCGFNLAFLVRRSSTASTVSLPMRLLPELSEKSGQMIDAPRPSNRPMQVHPASSPPAGKQAANSADDLIKIPLFENGLTFSEAQRKT
jgi:hypothetical protein